MPIYTLLKKMAHKGKFHSQNRRLLSSSQAAEFAGCRLLLRTLILSAVRTNQITGFGGFRLLASLEKINYFIIICFSSPTSLSCTLCIMKLKVFSLLCFFVYVVGKTNFESQ